MFDHNTQQATIDRLEEAVTRLTQSHNTLAQNHIALSQAQTSMTSKMDSILDRLAALIVAPPSPLPTSTNTQPLLPNPLMKHEIPWGGFSKSPNPFIIKRYLIKNDSPWHRFTWRDHL